MKDHIELTAEFRAAQQRTKKSLRLLHWLDRALGIVLIGLTAVLCLAAAGFLARLLWAVWLSGWRVAGGL